MLSETFDQTCSASERGPRRCQGFSDSIGQRGEQIKQLLANANKVARVFGDRSGQINGLLVNANTLLAAFRNAARR